MQIESKRNQLRKAKISARNQLTPSIRENFSLLITERIITSEIFQTSKTIMIYNAVKGEVCLKELEKEARLLGKQLCYPLCVSKNEMRALTPRNDLMDKKLAWKTLVPALLA